MQNMIKITLVKDGLEMRHSLRRTQNCGSGTQYPDLHSYKSSIKNVKLLSLTIAMKKYIKTFDNLYPAQAKNESEKIRREVEALGENFLSAPEEFKQLEYQFERACLKINIKNN